MTMSRPSKRKLKKIEQHLWQELPNIPELVNAETRNLLREILEPTFDIEIQAPKYYEETATGSPGWETVIWVTLPLIPNTDIDRRASRRLSLPYTYETDDLMLYFDPVQNRGQESEFSEALKEVGNTIAGVLGVRHRIRLDYVDAPKITQDRRAERYSRVVKLMFTVLPGKIPARVLPPG